MSVEQQKRLLRRALSEAIHSRTSFIQAHDHIDEEDKKHLKKDRDDIKAWREMLKTLGASGKTANEQLDDKGEYVDVLELIARAQAQS